MPNLLEDLVIDRVDLVDEGANSASFIEFYKRKENIMTFEEILAKMTSENAKVVLDAIASKEAEVAKMKEDSAAEIAKINEALAKANTEIETLKAADEEGKKTCKTGFDEEEVLKSMPESARIAFKKMKAQKEAAESEILKAKEAEVHATAVAKAAELKALPVPMETLVAVLKGSTPEMVDVLTAVSSALEGVTLGEVGKRGNTANTNAWDKIEAAAEDIAKAENISKQKAIAEVVKRKPELYKEYLEGGAN